MALRKSLTMSEPTPTLRRPPEQPVDHVTPIASPAKGARPPSRQGKVQFAGYLSVEAKRQIDVHAAKNGLTLQAIFEEAVNDWFAKHGLTRLAESRD